MRKRSDARLTNLLAAVATGLADAIGDSTRAASPMDPAAGAALVALLDFSPNGSVHNLSQVIGLTHSGTVRLVDRLVAAGYVERGAGPDARSLSIHLTASGEAVAWDVRGGRHRAMSEVTRQLSASERANLSELCETLITQITRRRLEQRQAGHNPANGALCRLCDFAACGRASGACPAARSASAFLEGPGAGPPAT